MLQWGGIIVSLHIPNIMKTLKGKNILVTGGAGFMGSNLVIALVRKGANVTVVDNMSPQQGGNLFNLEPVKDRISVDFSDIRDTYAVNQLVKGKDYIFHLARQTDHILSQTDPFPDIDVNVRGTAILLEACKKFNPTVRLIYTGTRGQYGPTVKLPVNETAPTNPRGIYEITNLTAEKMVLVYDSVHGIRSICLRLTNIYGPRAQMKTNHYGVVNWFVRLALDNACIPVYGDGRLKRDFLYIDDAIEAMLRCTCTEACYGEIINIGRDTPETFRELADVLVKTAKSGSWKFTPFSQERKAQEPGDFVSDITKIRKLTGWEPKTSLTEGLKKTIAFYRKNKTQYW
jgi:UDP-glucose 4-epimerase